MAKVRIASHQVDVLPRYRGRWLVHKGAGGHVAHAWPRKRGKAKSGKLYWLQKQFGYAAKMAANSEPIGYGSAYEITRGSDWVPRDLLMRAIYGKAYEVVAPDGYVYPVTDHTMPVPEETVFMGAMLTLESPLAAPGTGNYQVPWDTVQYDGGGWSDIVAQPTRLTVPAGVTTIQMIGHIGTAGNWSGNGYLFFYKNGLSVWPGRGISLNINSRAVMGISPPVQVVEGDYFELNFYSLTSDDFKTDDYCSFAAWSLG